MPDTGLGRRSEAVLETLRRRIEDGVYRLGDRLAGELALCEEFDVSRTTIRDAPSRLEIEGTVYRKQGAGTFVNRPGLQIKSRLDEIWSYEAVLEAHGYQPSVELLGVYKVLPEESIRSILGLNPGEEVTILRKLFSEDSEPVIFTETQIPGRFVPQELAEEQLTLPVYELVEVCCQQTLNYYLSEVVPIVADEELAQLLNVKINTPLLALEETGYNDDNEPILWARSIFRDDLVRFRMIRRTI